MKKLLCLILAVCAMLCVASCGEDPVYEKGTKFYNITTRVSTAAKETEQRHYYDESGKLTLTEVFTFDIQKEKVVIKDPVETIAYTYDEAGNLASKITTVIASGDVTKLSYKYDEDNNVIEYVSDVTIGKSQTVEKYTYVYVDGRVASDTYETSLLLSGETNPISQKSVTVYNYKNETALNCTFETTVTLTYVGQTTTYTLSGHQTYNERGLIASKSGETLTDIVLKTEGAVKAPSATVTYVSEKFRYIYQDDTDFDGDGKLDSVVVKINTYTEWDELLETERYLYDNYGNLLSYKQFNPKDNSVIYAEVNTVSPEAPKK